MISHQCVITLRKWHSHTTTTILYVQNYSTSNIHRLSLSELGKGNFSTVLLVEHKKSKKKFALKVRF